MRRLNTISLTVGEFHFGGNPKGARAVQIQIDGKDLYELIQEAGRPGPSAEEIDSALGLHPVEIALPSEHWLGAPDPELSEDGFALIYHCECGNWPCGGVLARIWVTPGEVAWSRFRGPRGGHTYSAGPFHFERQQYEDQLRELRP